jgi:hydroxysqualene synthase
MIRRVVEPRLNAAPLPEFDRVHDEHGQPYSLERAFAYCERMARSHYENFPVASRFVPARLRPYVWAVYAFARSADDFADESRYAGRRAEALAYWEEQLHRCYHGEAEHPVFVALRETIDQCNIPIQPLEAMLTAFTMDLTVNRYSTFEQLLTYCAHSAHPVGRLVLYVFDYRDPALHNYSDDLCTGLQLANFWQDVGVDLAKDRIYLPEEDRRHFGVSDDMLYARLCTPQFKDLMRYEVARARALFERGRPLIDKVGSDLGFELAMIWRGGTTILDKIDAVGYDVFRRRPTLNAADKARMVARAATQRWPRWAGAY